MIYGEKQEPAKKIENEYDEYENLHKQNENQQSVVREQCETTMGNTQMLLRDQKRARNYLLYVTARRLEDIYQSILKETGRQEWLEECGYKEERLAT